MEVEPSSKFCKSMLLLLLKCQLLPTMMPSIKTDTNKQTTMSPRAAYLHEHRAQCRTTNVGEVSASIVTSLGGLDGSCPSVLVGMERADCIRSVMRSMISQGK